MNRIQTEAHFDLDDTIMPWEKPNAVAYPAMVEALAKDTGIAVTELTEEVQRVNTFYGIMEHTPLVQSMSHFKDLPEDKQKRLIYIAYNAKNRALSGIDQPFPGIINLMQATRKHLQANRIHSDGPALLVQKRLQKYSLAGYFDHLMAMPSPPNDMFPKEFAKDKNAFPIRTSELDKHKPHSNVREILNGTSQQVSETVFMMGNSTYSDEGWARLNGTLFYHCQWSQTTPAEKEVLAQFAPVFVMQKNADEKTTKLLETADGFEKVEVGHPDEIIADMQKRKILPPTL